MGHVYRECYWGRFKVQLMWKLGMLFVLLITSVQVFSDEIRDKDRYLTRLSYGKGYDLVKGKTKNNEWNTVSATLLLSSVETKGIMGMAGEKINRISSISLSQAQESDYQSEWKRQDLSFVFRRPGFPFMGAITRNKTVYEGDDFFSGPWRIEENVTEFKLGWVAQNTVFALGYQQLEYDNSILDARGGSIEIDAVYPGVASGIEWRLYVNRVQPKQKYISNYRWFYVLELDTRFHFNENITMGASFRKGNQDLYKSRYNKIDLNLGLRLFTRWNLEAHYNQYNNIGNGSIKELRIQTGILF